MAFHFSELLTKLCFSVIILLSIFTIIILVFVAGSIVAFLTFFAKESIQKAGKAPITGTVFHQLFYFNTLFDYQTDTARKHPTFRVIMPSHSDIYTTNPANIEHILKTNFSTYNKGWYNYNIVRDLLGDGIFAVDGDKWRSQRKLASHEFSTKVLREFSSVVFRTTGAKLAKKIGESASSATTFDMQAGPRICLGKEFADRQMKILAAILLYFFKFRLGDESITVTYRVMFTLHMANGLPLLAFPRFN